MYALAQHEIWRQRSEEIRREVAAIHLEKVARANCNGEWILGRDLRWELARYAELLGKRNCNFR
jgi:hypothetical protein